MKFRREIFENIRLNDYFQKLKIPYFKNKTKTGIVKIFLLYKDFKYFNSINICIICLVLSLIHWNDKKGCLIKIKNNKNIEQNNQNRHLNQNSESEIKDDSNEKTLDYSFEKRENFAGKIYGIFFIMTFSYILLCLTLKFIAFKILNLTFKYRILLFLLSNMSEHISIFIVCVISILLCDYYNFNFQIPFIYTTNFFYIELVDVFLITNLMFSGTTFITCILNYNLNQNVVSNNIFKNVKQQYFIRFLVLISKHLKKKRKNLNDKYIYLNALNNFERIKSISDLNKIQKKLHDSFFESKYRKNDVMMDSYVRMCFYKNCYNLLFTEKNWGIKGETCKNKAIGYAQKIKSLNRFKINQVKDLKKYFLNDNIFYGILSAINISEEKNLDDTSFFIEYMLKTREESLSIMKNDKQMSSAIKSFQWFLYLLTFSFIISYLYSIIYGSKISGFSILSTLFGAGIAFQSCVKNTIDNCIFLFFVHPYDVGDRIFVNIDNENYNLIVKKLGIFSTTFLKDNGAEIYIPNSKLFLKNIINVRRGKVLVEIVRLSINEVIPEKTIRKLRVKINDYFKNLSDPIVTLLFIDFETITKSNEMNLKIVILFHGSRQNYAKYLEIKKEILLEINEQIKMLKINFMRPIQKVKVV